VGFCYFVTAFRIRSYKVHARSSDEMLMVGTVRETSGIPVIEHIFKISVFCFVLTGYICVEAPKFKAVMQRLVLQ